MVVGRKQMLHLSDAGEFQQRNKSHTMQHSAVDHIYIIFPSLFGFSSFSPCHLSNNIAASRTQDSHESISRFVISHDFKRCRVV